MIALEKAQAKVPVVPELLASDSTPEALVQQMAERGGRIAVVSPEGGPLRILDGRYAAKGTARLEELAQAYDGEPIKVRRTSREGAHVRRPALTLILTLQPSVLEHIRNAHSMRGQGIFGRICWLRPASLVGQRVPSSRTTPRDADAHARYDAMLRRLLDAEPAGMEHDGTPVPHRLTLSPEARDELEEYEKEIERELGPTGGLRGIADWAGKTVGRAVRIAVLLALADRADNGETLFDRPISRNAVISGVRICRALTTHARAVLGEMGMDQPLRLERKVLDKAMEMDDEERTVSALNQVLRSTRGLEAVEDLKQALDRLAVRGCVRVRPQSGSPTPIGGRPLSPHVAIHPKLLETHPRNPRNPPDQSRVWGSQGFQDADQEDLVRVGTSGEVGSDAHPADAGLMGEEAP